MRRRFFCYYLYLIILCLYSISLYPDSLTVDIFNRTNHQSVSDISFGNISQFTSLIAKQYLKVVYSVSNSSDWALQIFTDNTNSTCVGGLYNGLIGDTHTDIRIPLLWQVYTNTNQNITLTTNNDHNWGDIKDLRDTDWLSSKTYRIIASNNILGCFPNTNIIIPSTNLFFYLGAHFNVSQDDIFRTKLHIDLLPLSTLSISPGITYENIEEVNIIGDKIIIYSGFSDQTTIQTIRFQYRKVGESSFITKVFSPNSQTYWLKAVIPCEKVTTSGLEYYFSAQNSYKTTNTSVEFISVVPQKSMTIGPDGGEIELIDGNPEDGTVVLDIPKKALDANCSVLFKQIYQQDEMIAGNGIVNGQTALNMFHITPDLQFNKKVKLKLLYFDLNNNGKVETIEGVETSIDEKTLAICWWDGFEWRYIGGQINKSKNTIKTYLFHTGIFGIFSVGKLCADHFRPKERIGTPNGDGINDIIYFGGSPGDFEIKIYDVTGRRIKRITDRPEWDGKDDKGSIVESGVYLYQFRVNINGEEELVSGTIAIAK